MKTVFLLVIALVLALPLQAENKLSPADIAEAKGLLKNLIAIDTTNPPGNELAVAKFIQNYLEPKKEEKEGEETKNPISVKLFETAPNRGNLIIRVPGKGTKKPFLMMAHVDVVGAARSDWQSNPFQLTEREGYYYGRGVLDDKGMAAAGIVILKKLAQDKVPLERDVVLFLGADEESGSEFGMGWMLKYNRSLLDSEIVLNEGGRLFLEGDKITHAAIQNYEKIFMNVTLATEGVSGHSSLPHPDNAVVRLAQALAAVGSYQFPALLNEVTGPYFQGLSEIADHPLRADFKTLVSGDPASAPYKEAVKKISGDPAYNAMLRTTCVPTVVKAGFRENTVPGKAEATVNCRLLPADTRENVLARLQFAINDPKVTLTADEPEKPVLSPVNAEFFGAIKKVLQTMTPQAVTIPYMSPGATDSRKLRQEGLTAYGLVPFPVTTEELARMHGNDERLKISSFEFGVEFLYRLVMEFAERK